MLASSLKEVSKQEGFEEELDQLGITAEFADGSDITWELKDAASLD